MMITHEELVAKLCKPGIDIKSELTNEQAALWHMATGISGEAGELLDAIKKHTIYQKPLDIENIVEELGDLEFFMEGLRQLLSIPRTLTIAKNISKLSIRYESLGYTNRAAIDRLDKAKEQLQPLPC